MQRNQVIRIKPDIFEDLEDLSIPPEIKIMVPIGSLKKEQISKVQKNSDKILSVLKSRYPLRRANISTETSSEIIQSNFQMYSPEVAPELVQVDFRRDRI